MEETLVFRALKPQHSDFKSMSFEKRAATKPSEPARPVFSLKLPCWLLVNYACREVTLFRNEIEPEQEEEQTFHQFIKPEDVLKLGGLWLNVAVSTFFLCCAPKNLLRSTSSFKNWLSR